MDFIAEILSILIRPLYSIIQNYGWTIIIFTILIKLVTVPFTVKSQKSMAKMQQVQPLITEVQRKYANNKEKQQQELMKIYDKYEISPTGGCMPMILQLVILMGFIQIVYKPYTYLLGIGKDVIANAATELGIDSTFIVSNQLKMSAYPELMEKLGLDATSLNLNFLGFDLSKVLSENMGDIMMWILPVIALVLTILSTVMSQKSAEKSQNSNSKNDPQTQQAQAMSKSMFIMMPVMTAYITYKWPLGCALYWIISTLTQMIQQFIVNEFVIKKMKPITLKKKTRVKPVVLDTEETKEGDKND
ncbi:MAG: YidC/Oxa1 family membrane protein insertase [Clostridia bacterium]